ncbi:hypothetical protein [Citrobacter sp. Cy230]|uniref:hypothetical protein n=1 Tax=Citrobacter sp. Cy230 TaxID=2985163 RepID=UPI002578C32F|nr:hypothetical protein [Citrobacter sp. Cy230]MDM2723495.1 hypothetical protein [Citrobacter sp. Cy230]
MTTNNHPAHGPVSLDRLHQISEILSKAAAQSDGGNLGYAMADAVKVIDVAIASFVAEPVAWQWEYRDKRHVTNDQCRAKIVAEDGDVLVQPLYTAPPVPVVPDDLLSMAASAIEDLLEHTDPSTSYYSGVWADVPGKLRAAMLQAGNSPVTPDGYVLVPIEPTMAMLDEFDSIIDHGAEDSKDAWSRLIAAAPKQEVKNG